MNKTTKAIENYNKACNAIAELWVKKHEFDLTDSFWVGNTIGGVFCASDFFANMETMLIDLKLDAPEDQFIKWHDYCVRAGMLGVTTPNFHSWLKGCPIRSDDELKNLEALQAKIEALKKELQEAVNNENF